MEELLLKLGIPTYVQALYTTITATDQIQLPKELPNQIGWIYGLSTVVATVTPTNQALITLANAQRLYLTLVSGATLFTNPLRLDQLIYDSTTGCDQRYMRVNVPSKISLDQSYVTNPGASVASGVFALQLWYIDKASHKFLVDNGFLGIDGRVQKSA